MRHAVQAHGRVAVDSSSHRFHVNKRMRFDASVVDAKISICKDGKGLAVQCNSHAYPEFHLHIDIPDAMIMEILDKQN